MARTASSTTATAELTWIGDRIRVDHRRRPSSGSTAWMVWSLNPTYSASSPTVTAEANAVSPEVLKDSGHTVSPVSASSAVTPASPELGAAATTYTTPSAAASGEYTGPVVTVLHWMRPESGPSRELSSSPPPGSGVSSGDGCPVSSGDADVPDGEAPPFSPGSGDSPPSSSPVGGRSGCGSGATRIP